MSEVVRKITAEILEETAPEELIALDGYDPSRSRHGGAGRGPLGIGVEAAVTLLLPVIWKVTDEVLKSKAVDEMLKSFGSELGKRAANGALSALDRLRDRPLADDELPPALVAEVERKLVEEGVDLKAHSKLAAIFAAAILRNGAPH